MKARLSVLLLTAAIVILAALPLSASSKSFPEVIPLPNGFQPEGIAIDGNRFFVGSIPTGAIYSGDLRTGEGSVLVAGRAGRSAIGVDVDRGLIWVAGGATGRASVYDARTGADVAEFVLTTIPTFVNDVVVTRDGAYFTDSLNPVLYRVPIGPGGRPGAQADVQTIPLGGDIAYLPGFNVNGIDATPNGKTLVIVQSNTGKVFTVDADTGVTHEIDLGGGSVPNGDGILLDGKTLYVVQNRLNQIAVIELSPDLQSGAITGLITDSDFDVPTTIDEHGSRLYAVNARFGTPPTPSTAYQVVQVSKKAAA